MKFYAREYGNLKSDSFESAARVFFSKAAKKGFKKGAVSHVRLIEWRISGSCLFIALVNDKLTKLRVYRVD